MDEFQKYVLVIAEQSVLEKKNKIYRMVGKSLTKIICVFIIVSFTIGGVVWCVRRVFESAGTVSLSYTTQQSTNFNLFYQNNQQSSRQQDEIKVEQKEGIVPGVRMEKTRGVLSDEEAEPHFKVPKRGKLPASLAFDAVDEKK